MVLAQLSSAVLKIPDERLLSSSKLIDIRRLGTKPELP